MAWLLFQFFFITSKDSSKIVINSEKILIRHYRFQVKDAVEHEGVFFNLELAQMLGGFGGSLGVVHHGRLACK